MNEQIGDRIKLIRRKLGLTMEEFGELFVPKASKGVVSNWENNYNLPNNERLKKIAELGKVSVTYLLKGNAPDKIKNAREKLLSLQEEKMKHKVYLATIAVRLSGNDLSEESRKQGEKIFNDTNLAVQKLDEATEEIEKYIKNLEALENELDKNRELNKHLGGWGDPEEIPIEEIKKTLEDNGHTLKKNAQSKTELEDIFNSTQEITINGKSLTDEEKQKALQILKLTFDN